MTSYIRLEQLVKDLDEQFAVRTRAMAELDAHGNVAVPALVAARGGMTLEGRRRADGLLDKHAGAVLPSNALRGLRALEVLERAGSAEALRLVAELAGGEPSARLTQEAAAVLARRAGR
jgi:hypothetical protein